MWPPWLLQQHTVSTSRTGLKLLILVYQRALSLYLLPPFFCSFSHSFWGIKVRSISLLPWCECNAYIRNTLPTRWLVRLPLWSLTNSTMSCFILPSLTPIAAGSCTKNTLRRTSTMMKFSWPSIINKVTSLPCQHLLQRHRIVQLRRFPDISDILSTLCLFCRCCEIF